MIMPEPPFLRGTEKENICRICKNKKLLYIIQLHRNGD